MNKKLNIGDYVRTKDGEIGKIIECPEVLKENYGDWLWFEIIDEQRPIIKENIIKSSPNIIDLIQVGDYVNGYLVTDVYKPDGNEVFRIEIERDTLKGHIIDKSSQIKSIVTKEQFSQMEYKL